MKETDKTLYGLGLLLCTLITTTLLFFKFFNIDFSNLSLPCILRHVTGYYCPGCGSTRALKSILSLNIGDAIVFNIGFVYSLFLFIAYMMTNTIQILSKNTLNIGIRYKNIYVWIWVALLTVNFLIKNILHIFNINII